MEIRLTLTETELLAPDDTRIITGNEYDIGVEFANTEAKAKWDGVVQQLHTTCTQDDIDTEIDVPLTAAGGEPDYTATLPPLPGCRSVRIYLTGTAGDAERRTGTLTLPCTASIRDLGSDAYSAPYDAYNEMMRLLNGRLNGRMTQDEINNILDGLQAHTPEELNRTAYKRAIAGMSPETRLTGKLTLTDDTEVEVTNDILRSSTVAISTSVNRDNAILPGAVPASELTATIMPDAGLPHDALRGAEASLTFGVMQENGQWGEVPLGAYTVYNVGDDTATGTPITAYDSMKWLDGMTPAEAGFQTGKAYSPGQIIKQITTAAGIPFTQDVDFDADFTNNGKSSIAYEAHSYVVAAFGTLPRSWSWDTIISNADPYTTDEEVAAAIAAIAGVSITYKGTVAYPDELPTVIDDTLIAYRVLYGGTRYNVRAAGAAIMTARDLLMHTLTMLCAVGCIDRSTGELSVKPLNKRDATTEIIQNKVLRQRVSRLPYRLFLLDTVCDYPNEEGVMVSEERREYTFWGDGVTALLPSNPLLTGLVADNPRVAIFQSINALADALDPVTFRPARVETYGDPSIEPWEWLTVKAPNGETSVPAGSLTWRYRGTQIIDTGGADAVSGLEITQAERAVLANKITASQSSQNTLRAMYGHLMTTHAGLHSFRHEEIGHYQYTELGRREDDEE